MIRVIKPGFYTSIQDQGRFGFRHFGVPVSGAMDQHSYALANQLLGNTKVESVLEITMTGPTLVFEIPTSIAITGARFVVTLNDVPIGLNEVLQIKENDLLKFGKLEQGFRAYLAIKGGFCGEKALGSQSQYVPVTKTSKIEKNQKLLVGESKIFAPKISEIRKVGILDEQVLEVYPGPEYHLFSQDVVHHLCSQPFTIAKENNRMAYQLEELSEPHQISMITSSTLPGTVQVTPSGRLIILMRDGQTTGGYPRLFQLSEKSINILAQKKHLDVIHFSLHTMAL